ncbi:MAG: hypothetical protein ACSW8F_00410, partial [bacterium]
VGEGERYLILCSFSKKERPLRLPKDFPRDAALVLSNYPDPQPAAPLRPYETRVYRAAAE